MSAEKAEGWKLIYTTHGINVASQAAGGGRVNLPKIPMSMPWILWRSSHVGNLRTRVLTTHDLVPTV
jgi:hypothetical protein